MSVAGTEGTLHQLLIKLGRAGTTDQFRLVCLIGLDGSVLECSPATLESAGLTQADAVGRPFWTTIWWKASRAAGEKVREAVLQAARGEFVRCDVPALVGKNGTETVLLDLTVAPVRSEDGARTWLLVEARDVMGAGGEVVLTVRGTELLAHDTCERHREKIARITLDSMVQFVGLLDAEGTVLEINQVALDAVGIKLSDVEGRPFWTTFWWQVSEEINFGIRDSIRRAAQGEFVRWDTEIYGRAGGKETIVIDASLMPVKDEAGKVVFIAGRRPGHHGEEGV
jgi:PAS domain S-box-containing protein